MNAFIYQADIYCTTCAGGIKDDLDAKGRKPADAGDERTFDSDDYPKGPYKNGGGKADSFQHCDSCGVFLHNPLTDDGVRSAVEALDQHVKFNRGTPEVLDEWAAELADYRLTDEQRKTLDEYGTVRAAVRAVADRK